MERRRKRASVRALGLPRDVVMGDLLISLVGRYELHIENYRSLLLCTDSCVRIQGTDCRLAVCGRGLRIERFGPDEMTVTGRIASLSFETV